MVVGLQRPMPVDVHAPTTYAARLLAGWLPPPSLAKALALHLVLLLTRSHSEEARAPAFLPPHHPCLATAWATSACCRPPKPGDVTRQRGDLQRQGTITCCLWGKGGVSRKKEEEGREPFACLLESRRMTTRDLAHPPLGQYPRVVCSMAMPRAFLLV